MAVEMARRDPKDSEWRTRNAHAVRMNESAPLLAECCTELDRVGGVRKRLVVEFPKPIYVRSRLRVRPTAR